MEVTIIKTIQIDPEIFNDPVIVKINGKTRDGSRATFSGQAVDLTQGGCLIHIPSVYVDDLIREEK